jgi:adenylosuccinate synthase
MRVIVLSGSVASGKTSLAEKLVERYERMRLIKTHHLIRQEIAVTELERSALQKAGERLDDRTRGRWVANAVGRAVVDMAEGADVIIDSCKIEGQIDGLREAFGKRVVHIHLRAPKHDLERRYRKRKSRMKELRSYAQVLKDPTERQVDSLAEIADVVIDTHRCTAEDVFVRAAAQLGLYGRSYAPLVDVLVGGQWGSEGKGHVVSYLAPEYDILVRVGGPNAGHQVYREDGAITYHHLPSGTQECEAKIVIGPGAVLRVNALLEEISVCQLSTDRLVIDPRAMIIEDADIRAESTRLRDIGSTKQGVGAATSRKVLRTAANPRVRLAQHIPALQPFVHESRDVLDDAFRAGKRVFVEGTQGTGLSLHHGEYPYVTSRETSVSGCLSEAGIAPSRVRRIIMLVRTYPIRVGGKEESGPMGIEINWSEVARRSGHRPEQLRKAEHTSTTKRLRRVAEFSWTLLRRAASLNGPTDIALSFADYISKKNERARRFEQLTDDTIEFVEEIERVATAPVSLIVTRFGHSERSIIDRRKWGIR